MVDVITVPHIVLRIFTVLMQPGAVARKTLGAKLWCHQALKGSVFATVPQRARCLLVAWWVLPPLLATVCLPPCAVLP